jgi:hypothetical protein
MPSYIEPVVTSKHNIDIGLDMRNGTILHGEHLIGSQYDDANISVSQSTIPPGAVYNDPNGIPATYDNDKNGKINQGELVDGLQAYSNDKMSQGDLVDLLQAYSNST